MMQVLNFEEETFIATTRWRRVTLLGYTQNISHKKSDLERDLTSFASKVRIATLQNTNCNKDDLGNLQKIDILAACVNLT